MIVSGDLENVPLVDVVQVLAHSRQSGALFVDGAVTEGTVLFKDGAIVCAESTSTRLLLERAAKEVEPGSRRSLLRAQTLATLTELLALRKGVFRFQKNEQPFAEIASVDVRSFYASWAMDTGDLLLMLATVIDKKEGIAPAPAPEKPSRDRAHARYAPTVVRAVVSVGESELSGYLTNMSEGGSFFHGEALPEVESAVTVRFELPASLGTVTTKARVVWARTDARDGRNGVGLAFTGMSDASLENLRAYIERFEKLVDTYGAEPVPDSRTS